MTLVANRSKNGLLLVN